VSLSYCAIYAYPWDLAEADLTATIAEIRGLGLDTITLAASYHAGKFLRPRGRNGKVYFPEDGAVYFRFDPSRYGRLKPALSRLAAEQDVLGELARRDEIASVAWLVLLHNTRLGMLHPEVTVANAFGDRYVYSLCPSAPEAREYAIALARDSTDRYPVAGLALETPGFLPYAHGFHHEFALIRQNPWLNQQLGLCFCDHCVQRAEAAGIGAGRLKARVRADVEAYLDSELELPDDMAEAMWLADTRTDGALGAFLAWRTGVVTSLIADIRAGVRRDATIAVIPSVARPTGGAWYEGSDISALAAAAGIIEACFYEPTPARVRADAFDARRRVGAVGRLHGVLRPSYPDLGSRDAVVQAAAELRAAGVSGIAFYNWGHLRRTALPWIADAVAAFSA
jgi:hypothetical protein